MSKINNKDAYPIDNQLSLDDFLIGSDADNLDATRNYLLRGIFSTFKTSLNLSSIEYSFAGGSDPELNEEDNGYFTTNGNNTLAGAITTININKDDLNGVDITSLITTISGNLSSFMLVLYKPSATGQVFYFQISAILDNTTHYALTVANFVGGNSLEDESTYTLRFDLAGVPSIINETDTLATVTARGATTSVASSFTSGLTVSAVDAEVMSFTRSGNANLTIGHSGTGNLSIEKSGSGNILIDGAIVSSTLIGNWNTAFGWGNHALAGYLTSYTETDPVFAASDVFGVTTADIASWDAVRADVTALRLTQWDTAFGWGDHGAAGYITSYTETDPVFTASAAFSITTTNKSEWTAAYTWGDHAAVDYIRESLPADKTGGDLVFHDNIKAKFGTSGDMSIFHTGLENIIQVDLGDLIIRDGATARFTFGRTTGDLAITGNATVADEAYAIGWNSSLEVPTKNALYDKIETLAVATDYVLKAGDTMTGNLTLEKSTPEINLTHTGAAADEGKWDILATGNDFRIRSILDSGALAGTPLQFARTGGTVSAIELNSTALTWNGDEVWTAGNDGSGSGLDADTLRTFAPTTANTGDTIVLRDVDGDITGNRATFSDRSTFSGNAVPIITEGTGLESDNTGVNYLLGRDSTSNNMWYVGCTAATDNDVEVWNYSSGSGMRLIDGGGLSGLQYVSGSAYTVWHSGNDGSASGLDADLLDGKQLSSSGDKWDVVPFVASDGVMDIGRYLDFHDADTDTSTHTQRLDAVSTSTLRLTSESATDARFDVYLNSADFASIRANGSGGFIILSQSTGSDTTLSSYTTSTFYHDVTASGADMNAVDFNLTSDERLKENIKPLGDYKITTNWVEYNWIESGKADIGLIAQDLEKTNPEFIKEEDGGFKHVNYTKVLVAKMAEKDRQIESLEQRVDRLENLISQQLNLN